MSISINPFQSDPSVIGAAQQFNLTGTSPTDSTGLGGVDTGTSFDSILGSEVSGLQDAIQMAKDKLSSPLHTIQPLLDKIKNNESITNTDSVSQELFRVANEIIASLKAAPQPDQNLMIALGQITQGLSSLVEEYGSKDALDKLTMLYTQCDMNSVGHHQIKIQFIQWTRIEIFSLDAQKKKDPNLSPSEGLTITQQLQALLANFVDSIKGEDIAQPLLPFFDSSRFVDAAKEAQETEVNETSEKNEVPDGDSFQEVVQSVSNAANNVA